MKLRYTRYTVTYNLRRSVRRSTKPVVGFSRKQAPSMNSDNSQLTRQTGTGRGSQAREGNKSARWDDYRVRIFCRLCIAEVNNGHTFGNKLTELGFENVQRGFQAETGLLFKTRALSSQWTKLRKIHTVWMRLKNSTGISLSHDGLTIIADPSWWREKAQGCDEVKYLVGGYPHMADMHNMFSRTRDMANFGWSAQAASGPVIPNISAFDSSSSAPININAAQPSQQNNLCGEGCSPPVGVRNDFMPSRMSTSSQPHPSSNVGSGSTSSGRGKRKRGQQAEDLDRLQNLLSEVTGGLGKLSENINPPDLELERVMDVVAMLPNVIRGDPFWMKAGDFFMDNRERRKFFIRVLQTPEERYAFLQGRL